MRIIDEEDVVLQVFEAIDEGKYLPLEKRVLLESLSASDDGVFETPQAWRSFLFGNFAEHCQKGQHWLEGECKESTVKRWCYAQEQYDKRFVQRIGRDKYLSVNKDELKFEFTFDANFFPWDSAGGCNRVDIFVKATWK